MAARPLDPPPHILVGLYTSPHLVAVRERIRINGAPISEEEFAKFFFEVWDRLNQNVAVSARLFRLLMQLILVLTARQPRNAR